MGERRISWRPTWRAATLTALGILGGGFTIALLASGVASGRFPIPGGDYLYVFDPVGDAVRAGTDPYASRPDPATAFYYAPPWAFAFAAISWLPPLIGHLIVATTEVFALRYIVGSWRAAGIVGLCPLLAFELALGNINLIVGALIVAAVRGSPWAAVAGATAKLSPILALRPSRAAIAPLLVAAGLCAPWGASWAGTLLGALNGPPLASTVPITLTIRAAAALGLLALRRPWATGLAAVVALPALHYQSLLLLIIPVALAVIPKDVVDSVEG